MGLKTKSERHHRRRSIGQWCQDFWLQFDKHIHSLGKVIYNREHRQIIGRDGLRWSKLAAFYFFLYMTLGGFFCVYLSLYMSSLPLNQPRYKGKASRLTSRTNPLSPGLGFRPQPRFDPKDAHAIIHLSTNSARHGKRSMHDDIGMYTKNLDEFLNVYYSMSNVKNFTINNVGDCHSNNQYGFQDGKPCFLIKINKIVGFVPEIGSTNADQQYGLTCNGISNIPVRCIGEKPSDQAALGSVLYHSESGSSEVCGSFDIKHFPYNGKEDRKDVYQSPYVWVQFRNLTADVLISVECRIYGANIFYNRITQRGSVRFQLYVKKNL